MILSELAVPTATHLGFNTRSAREGELVQVIELVGTSHQFARTRAERVASGNPRPSLEERYSTEEDYLARTRAAALGLVADGLLLDGDVEAVCATALAHYRAETQPPSGGALLAAVGPLSDGLRCGT